MLRQPAARYVSDTRRAALRRGDAHKGGLRVFSGRGPPSPTEIGSRSAVTELPRVQERIGKAITMWALASRETGGFHGVPAVGRERGEGQRDLSRELADLRRERSR